MYKDEFKAVCNAGKSKLDLLNSNPIGYFFSAMTAGLFISFGVFICYSSGASLAVANPAGTKLITSAVFAIALSLVIAAGAELFTGNCFVLTAASLNKTISWGSHARLGIVAYLGNFVGMLISIGLFQLSGVTKGVTGELLASSSAAKMAYPPVELLIRGILCNILVCIAVWCSIKLKNEAAKLMIALWCVFAFMICGFEHSIANMGILALGLLNAGSEAVSIGGYVYNLALSTLGNIIGGMLFVALPYYMVSKATSK